MLSPGKYHERVPRGQKENRKFRRALLERARGDRGFQQAIIDRCREDCLFWTNAFLMQFNPNSIGSHSERAGPFITWEFQDEAIEFILHGMDRRHDVPIEKSREMGGTYICLIPVLNRYLFRRHEQFIMISRNAEVVDKAGSQNTLFAKIDFMVEHLPSWMTRGRARRTKFAYYNPLLRSGITGQASTAKAGVGDRATAMFIDEFSQIQEDWEVWGRTSDTTRCRIFNGTHLGLDTAFYKLTQREGVRKIVMHWSQHPDKRRGLYRWNAETQAPDILDHSLDGKLVMLGDAEYEFPGEYPFSRDGTPSGGPYPGIRSPWYDNECMRRPNARSVAMDLDINPVGSVSQVFDPLMIARLVSRTYEPLFEGDILFNRDTGEPQELISSPGGPLRLWVHPIFDPHPRVLRVPKARYAAGADVSAGTGATPSCWSCARIATGEKVAEFADPNLSPDKFAVKCVALNRLFCDGDGVGAYFAWEKQGPGSTFGVELIRKGYRHVYMDEPEGDLMSVPSTKPGWSPGKENKRLLIEQYMADLESGRFTNPSAIALQDTAAFKYDGRGQPVNSKAEVDDDPSGARENHADRVIADALCAKMVRERGGGIVSEPKREEPVTVLSRAGRERLWEERAVLEEVWG